MELHCRNGLSPFMREAKARAMAAKTDVLERLRACHKEAQSAIRTALEVDERDGGACLSV